MDLYGKIAERIISEQEKIIGPVAIEQAKQVTGMAIDWKNHEIRIEGDEKKAIGELVDKYKELFGKVAIEVCKDALKTLNPPKEELPENLK